MNPMVVVVIVNWNGEAVLADCVASVLASSHSPLRVTVVDNGSTDGSLDRISERYPELSSLRLTANYGFAVAANQGLSEALRAGADYVLILNNDAVLAADCASRLVLAAESAPEYAAVSGKILYADPPDRIWYAGGSFAPWRAVPQHWARKKQDTLQSPPDVIQDVSFVSGCALLLRASAIRRVGLFDERLFAYGEDVDLCVRLRKAGYLLGYLPGAVTWHRESFTSRRGHGNSLRYRLYVANSVRVLWWNGGLPYMLQALPLYIWQVVIRLVALSILRREYRSAQAVFFGLADVIVGRFARCYGDDITFVRSHSR